MKQTIITALLAPSIGIMASISDEAYLVKAFDTQRNDFKNKLIHDLGISIGVTMFAQGEPQGRVPVLRPAKQQNNLSASLPWNGRWGF